MLEMRFLTNNQMFKTLVFESDFLMKQKLCQFAKFHSDSSKNEDRIPKSNQFGQTNPPL